MDRTDLGSYVEHEGRPAVRFVRRYPHPVERVWAAVTEPSELAHWFPSAVTVQPRAGGTIAFSFDPHTDPSQGTVLAYEPPRRFAFTWGGDELHLSLQPDDGGGCVFTLVNVLEARDTAARNGAGWTVCLAELDAHLAGGAAEGPHSAAALDWRPVYQAHVDAGVPHGAPIPTGA